MNSVARALYEGDFSVAVFFVMSGYVLSRKFFITGEFGSLPIAVCKRYLRLGLPVLAAVMLGWLLMQAGAFRGGATSSSGFLNAAYQFPPSIVDALGDGLYRALALGESRYDYILWTINIEFIGSIALFVFLAWIGKIRYAAWVALALSVETIALRFSDGLLYALFFAGAYMHIWQKKAQHWSIALALVCVGLFLGGYSPTSTAYGNVVDFAIWCERQGLRLNWPIFFHCVGAMLLVTACVNVNAFSRVLASCPLAWLGKVSFSLYLVHSFVLSSIGALVYALAGNSKQAGGALATIVVVTVSLIAAAIFERLADGPSVRLANAFAKRADRLPFVGSAAKN